MRIFSIPIQGHEAERRIDGFIYDGQVETVAVRDGAPVVDSGAAQRVNAQRDVRLADHIQIEHGAQILHVFLHEIVGVRGRGFQRVVERDSPHAFQFAIQEFIGGVLDKGRGLTVGGSAMRRVVLEAAVFGGLWEGVTTIPSARPVCLPRLCFRMECEMAGVGV